MQGMEFAPIEVVATRMVKGRKRLGKTQQEVAEDVGCKQPTVSSWEDAQKMPERERWQVVARAYGYASMEELFFVVAADKAAGA